MFKQKMWQWVSESFTAKPFRGKKIPRSGMIGGQTISSGRYNAVR